MMREGLNVVGLQHYRLSTVLSVAVTTRNAGVIIALKYRCTPLAIRRRAAQQIQLWRDVIGSVN
jgi:hypothetical protein